MSHNALGQLKHLKTARARWPFPDVLCTKCRVEGVEVGLLLGRGGKGTV